MATPPQPQPHPGPFQAPQPQPGQPYQPYQPPHPHAAGGQGHPAPFPQTPHPHPHPHHAGCRLCGAVPAMNVTVRGHQGILILMRFLTMKGPFCRNCGIALCRDMSGRTLWQGWWSPFSLFLLTPFTLIWNLVIRIKLNKLPAPAPGQPGPQLDPGVPLYRRPAVLGVLIPVVWFLYVTYRSMSGA